MLFLKTVSFRSLAFCFAIQKRNVLSVLFAAHTNLRKRHALCPNQGARISNASCQEATATSTKHLACFQLARLLVEVFYSRSLAVVTCFLFSEQDISLQTKRWTSPTLRRTSGRHHRSLLNLRGILLRFRQLLLSQHPLQNPRSSGHQISTTCLRRKGSGLPYSHPE